LQLKCSKEGRREAAFFIKIIVKKVEKISKKVLTKEF